MSVSKARDLGVIVQDDLRLNTHIDNICKSAAIGIHRIGKIRHFLDKAIKERLVHAFIFIYLDFNNGLFLGISETHRDKLQRVQNSAARLVTRKRKFERI